MEKSHGLFVDGTRVMLTSRLAYENTSSLQHSINIMLHMLLIECIILLINEARNDKNEDPTTLIGTRCLQEPPDQSLSKHCLGFSISTLDPCNAMS